MLSAATACAPAEAPDDDAPAGGWRKANNPPEKGRVALCHKAGANRHTLRVAAAAIPAHLEHGDTLGECASACASAECCGDGNACTTDTCLPDGTCAHVAVDCNDGNPCTTDSCSADLGCGSVPADGGPCDDGNECTDVDACLAGSCRGDAIEGCCLDASDCVDDDSCTVDACVGQACANTPLGCTDDDACIVGFCDPSTGECDATPVACDDGDPCTIDSCDSASGCAHEPSDDVACGATTQISSAAMYAYDPPSISGTHVVWLDNIEANGEVVLHDLAAGTTQSLTNTPSHFELDPDVGAGHVVWRRDSTDAREIVIRDIATGEERIMESGVLPATSIPTRPKIAGGFVAFQRTVVPAGSQVAEFDIGLYDIATGEVVAPDPAFENKWNPRIGGGHIAYVEPLDGSWDVGVYSMATGTALQIATGPADQVGADTDGQTVVWIETGANHRVMAYDVAAGTTRELASGPAFKGRPRVSGDRVVWIDVRNGDGDVYVYDLGADREELIAGGPGAQEGAEIDGDRIVYTHSGAVHLFTFAGG